MCDLLLAALPSLLAVEISVTDMLLILLYLGVTGYLGWLGYKHTKSAADYLIAGRKVHPFIMAMSYGATFISTSAIVGFGGVAAMFGMSLLWLTFLNIFVGIFIAFVFLGGPTRRIGHRLNAHTFPEFLGKRYESKAIQVGAGLVIFLFMPLYAAAVLIGGTEFLVKAFAIDYTVALCIFAVITAMYVFFGGLLGVLYTDTFQGIIMTLGMLFLLIWAYAAVGGVTQGNQDLTAMKDEAFVGFKAIGHQGWTSMPRFGWGPAAEAGKPSPYILWWTVVGTITMGVGIGVLAQPQLVVRFLTVKSGKELNRALLFGGAFILLMAGVAYTVGAVSNVYFYKHEIVAGAVVKVEQANIITKSEPGKEDKTAPCMLMHLDTTGSGKADVQLVVEGVGGARKIMPRAVVKDVAGGETYEAAAEASPATGAHPLLAWTGKKVEVRTRATSFTRAVSWDEGKKAWFFNPDAIVPTYVTQAMPRWFRVLFLLTLLAAAMSTMSSQYHTLGTAIGHDVIGTLLGGRVAGGQLSHEKVIFIVRAGIIVGLVLAVTLGYYTRGGYVVARSTAIFFGLCASAFLPAFIGGLFWKSATRAGAIASMTVGFLTTAFWLLLVKEAEAGALGLVRQVTGGANSVLAAYPNWPTVDPLLVALPVSVATFIWVSLLTRKPSPAHLEKCFG